MKFEHNVLFYKMHGSGNDFVLIPMKENIVLDKNEMSKWAKTICKRKFCVGADGLIFLTKQGIENKDASYKWHFYNSDGSRAEMCGNGSRCAAKLAYKLGFANKHHFFETDAGIIETEVLEEDNVVKVQLTPPQDFKKDIGLRIGKEKLKIHFVNTGVPHAVVLVEDIQKIDINTLGSKIRYHDYFKPQGTNVNFVSISNNTLHLRTYERGVEAETYACGTGAAASAFVTKKIGLIQKEKIPVITSGGEKLVISIYDEKKLYLTGGATLVYEGKLNLKEVGLI